ncbi:MAG: TraR/DksA family transcriptional regulator [Steroidobacteraceae bacterium]
MDHEQIRRKLLARRAELQHRSSRVKADLKHSNDPLVADFADQATQRENEDVLSAIGESADVEIAQLNQALRRLEAGEYGSCVSCGAQIDERRLEVVPYADRCARCAS